MPLEVTNRQNFSYESSENYITWKMILLAGRWDWGRSILVYRQHPNLKQLSSHYNELSSGDTNTETSACNHPME